MTRELVPIGEADDSLLESVARLHASELAGLMADLGPEWTKRFYREAVRDESAIGFAFVEVGEIVGFVFGGAKPDALLKGLRENAITLGLQLLFRRPLVLFQLVASSLVSRATLSGIKDNVELMYVAVSPKSRGKGLGASLVRSFVEAAARRGAKSVTLSVEHDNATAIQLYERLGFRIERDYREGRYRRFRMIRPLS